MGWVFRWDLPLVGQNLIGQRRRRFVHFSQPLIDPLARFWSKLNLEEAGDVGEDSPAFSIRQESVRIGRDTCCQQAQSVNASAAV
ncbi:hypothetical protein GBA52_022101 [Prunus armeniaca]|nr:hypothetical protein GBA52_022101 [Prunus armeniaca]